MHDRLGYHQLLDCCQPELHRSVAHAILPGHHGGSVLPRSTIYPGNVLHEKGAGNEDFHPLHWQHPCYSFRRIDSAGHLRNAWHGMLLATTDLLSPPDTDSITGRNLRLAMALHYSGRRHSHRRSIRVLHPAQRTSDNMVADTRRTNPRSRANPARYRRKPRTNDHLVGHPRGCKGP